MSVCAQLHFSFGVLYCLKNCRVSISQLFTDFLSTNVGIPQVGFAAYWCINSVSRH